MTTNDGTNMVRDLAPGTLLELRTHTDFRTLDAVVISRLVDHMLVLAALRNALLYDPGELASQNLLWMPPAVGAMLHRVSAACFDGKGEKISTGWYSQHGGMTRLIP